MARIDINIPYAEKDEAKMLGARWDSASKTWYVPDGVSVDHFLKWLSDCNVIAPYWYIAQTSSQCWKCGCETVVTSILLPEGHQALKQDGDGPIYWKQYEIPAFIFYIYDIPNHILKNFERITHYLSKDYSKTVDEKYWMNHCKHCHMKQGDFQLHCEVDGAFTPSNREQASGIYLTRIEQSFSASCGSISHEHLHFRFGPGEKFFTSGEWFTYMDKI